MMHMTITVVGLMTIAIILLTGVLIGVRIRASREERPEAAYEPHEDHTYEIPHHQG